MREQLQELVDRWHARGIPSILWVLAELKRILATEPPTVSVKAGWVVKDSEGVLTWFASKPEWYPSHGEWATPEPTGDDWTEASCVTDPWPDKPNGGPECVLEVK